MADRAVADRPPKSPELAKQLGRAHGAFRKLSEGRAGAVAEWKRYGKTAPWVLKVTEAERTLFYITPGAGEFEVTVVLGERATAAALGGRVRRALHASIRAAKPYVEGRPVRVVVSTEADLAGVEELVAVKLKPVSENAP
jgi:hypothetical protein